MSNHYYEDEPVSIGNLKLINHIRDNCNLKSSEKLIALILASRRNSKTLQCNPSISTLQRDSSLSRPTVVSCIKSLQDKNVVKVVKQFFDKVQCKHMYFFYYDAEDQVELVESSYSDVPEHISEILPW